VTYRDLGADPLPHLDSDAALARRVAPAEHAPTQATTRALTKQRVHAVKRADTILLGLPRLQLRRARDSQGLGRSPHRSGALAWSGDQGRALCGHIGPLHLFHDCLALEVGR
jgi:hypothetical protein